MVDTDDRKGSPFVIKLRNYFTTGLLVLAPTVVSIWVLVKSFLIFDSILGRFYDKILYEPVGIEHPIPGLGAVTLVVIVVLIGMSARMYAGRKFLDLWEKTINRIPLLNRVYLAIRQLSDAFVKGKGIIFQQAVIVQYPRRGVYSIGFVTNQCSGPFCTLVGENVSSVFIPTTPNPTSGVLIFVPDDEITPLGISVEDAMKLVISAGTVTPDIPLDLDRLP